MKNSLIILSLLSLLLLTSCQLSKVELIDESELWNSVTSRNAEVSIKKVNSSKVLIDIYSQSPSLIEVESRKTMLGLFIDRYLKENEIDQIEVKYVDELFENEVYNYSYSKHSLDSISTFYKNQKMKDFHIYTLQNFDQIDMFKCDFMLEDLPNIMGDRFPAYSDFWSFLNDYGLERIQPGFFGIFVEVVTIDATEIPKDKFDYYMEYGNH